MSDDTLKISIDSTDATKAAAELDKLTQASAKNESSVQKLVNAFRNSAAGAAQIAPPVKALGDNMDATAKKADAASHATSGLTREIIVLSHEALQGNFTRFGGSLLVLAEYSKTATAALSVLVGPLGIAAAVIAAVGYEAFQGAKELDTLNKSLILTGNQAGLTSDSFRSLAADVAKDTSATVGKAKDAIQALAASGVFGPDLIRPAADAVTRFAQLSGQSAEDVVADFAKMQNGVAKWAEEHNKSLHFLDTAQFEYIRTLEQQGNAEQAELAVVKALFDHMGGIAPQQVGLLETALHGLAVAFSQAAEAAKGITFDRTIGQQIAATRQQLDLLQGLKAKGALATMVGGLLPIDRDAQIEQQQEQLRHLNRAAGAQQQLANAAADAAATHAKGIASSTYFQGLDDQTKNVSKLTRALEELHRQQDAHEKDTGKAFSPDEKAKQEAEVRELNKPKGGASSPINTDRSSLKADLEAIKAAEAMKLDAYRNAQTILDSLRAAGLVSDQQFYSAERKTAEDTAAAQIEAIDAQIDAEKRKQFTGRNAANEEFARQGALAKLEADRAKAVEAAGTRESVLTTEATAAARARANAYTEADQAATRALLTLQRQHDLEVQIARLGPDSASRATSRFNIDETFRTGVSAENDSFSRVPKYDDGTTINKDDQERHDKQLALLKKTHDGELAEDDRSYVQRQAAQASFYTGLDRATNTYIEGASHVADLTDQAFTHVFSSVEDALTTFVTTGKLNFKALADSIIADFVRVEVKAAESKVLKSFSDNGGFGGLLSSIGGLFGGGGAAGAADTASLFANGFAGFAAGGYANPGSIHEVNERGPELLQSGGRQFLMMGNQGGTVVPHDKAFGGDIHVINQTTGRVDKATQTALSNGDRAILLQESEDHLARRLSDPNSTFSRAMQRNVKAERVR